MSIFGFNKHNDDELDRLRYALQQSEKARKKLTGELAQARNESAALLAEIEVCKTEVEKAKAKVQKAIWRQKNSVARANRYKARLPQIDC